MEYVLSTNCLSKSYKHFQAVEDVSMHVPEGSIYGFIGKNGAGKTTLIRLICGLQKPSEGSYSLYGVDYQAEGIHKVRRRMGAVVETPAVYRELTAEDNLKMQYKVLGMPSFRGIFELLELVGLSKTGKKKVKDFSLGMKQRLGIAIALVGNPDFIVLDEPINGLDPLGIIEIRELILKLNREKRITILISSHILGELSKLATHYGFIDRGHMLREISAEELEQACRKCVRVTVDNMKSLCKELTLLGLEYRVVSETEADIFDDVSVSSIALACTKSGCELLSIKEHDESLETYFMNLVGGERLA